MGLRVETSDVIAIFLWIMKRLLVLFHFVHLFILSFEMVTALCDLQEVPHYSHKSNTCWTARHEVRSVIRYTYASGLTYRADGTAPRFVHLPRAVTINRRRQKPYLKREDKRGKKSFSSLRLFFVVLPWKGNFPSKCILPSGNCAAQIPFHSETLPLSPRVPAPKRRWEQWMDVSYSVQVEQGFTQYTKLGASKGQRISRSLVK